MQIARPHTSLILSVSAIAIFLPGCKSEVVYVPSVPVPGSDHRLITNYRMGSLRVEYLVIHAKRNRPAELKSPSDDLGFQVIEKRLKDSSAPFSKDWNGLEQMLRDPGHGCAITVVDKGVAQQNLRTGLTVFKTKAWPSDPLKFTVSGQFRTNFVEQNQILGLQSWTHSILGQGAPSNWSVFEAREDQAIVSKLNETEESFDVVAWKFHRDTGPDLTFTSGRIQVRIKTRDDLAKSYRVRNEARKTKRPKAP